MKRSAIPDLILQQGADAIGVWKERYSRRELDGVDIDGLRHQFLRMLASSRRRLRRPAVPNPPQELDAPCRDMHGFDKRMANFFAFGKTAADTSGCFPKNGRPATTDSPDF